jgi:hypothetical protein
MTLDQGSDEFAGGLRHSVFALCDRPLWRVRWNKALIVAAERIARRRAELPTQE